MEIKKMKKVQQLLKALNDLKTVQEEAIKEVNDQLISLIKSHSEEEKKDYQAALKIMKNLWEQRSEAIKVLSQI
jgi:hypothetical protein